MFLDCLILEELLESRLKPDFHVLLSHLRERVCLIEELLQLSDRPLGRLQRDVASWLVLSCTHQVVIDTDLLLIRRVVDGDLLPDQGGLLEANLLADPEHLLACLFDCLLLLLVILRDHEGLPLRLEPLLCT